MRLVSPLRLRGAVCAAGLVAIAAGWALVNDEPPAPDYPPPPPPDLWRLPREGDQVPGKAIPAAAARGLSESDLVIGVAAGGGHRAYPVRGFWHESHTVNDLIRGVPVTVTYCGLCECARVFAGGGAEPLDVYSAGYLGGLILTAGGCSYRQDTLRPLWDEAPPFPYREHPFRLVTWGEWRSAHPGTDVSCPRH